MQAQPYGLTQLRKRRGWEKKSRSLRLKFRVLGLGFRGFGVQGSGCRVEEVLEILISPHVGKVKMKSFRPRAKC